ncbi:bifunctional hydroxymethylpyrimidine kinase/phosphomethylpyrimidine kinase [Rhodopirellula sp. JC740]|uniref:hydroxymethylpyrimidine kinase n=1 Tax=Rhodopirellula halodulae TaxID=2894198 RepID=A0ABS8NL92_9BACT|nr:bifunctional hydroxymethylpyrimidine kinase/phosphomethylpyrimidine kinase [Rhodopirellula sp. JC740]MCC9644295.1 bifunctional hydroxymethylpyrimidine kinase/phosphomethylpyrimidine kinase [Rhodopirellula sp. JC740]
MPKSPPIALTIAGSDPSGGAGLQADLKTFHNQGVYGCSVVTLLTAQNTQGVQGIHPIPPGFVLSQWRSVTSDLRVSAIKTGALGTAETIDLVADCLSDATCPIVIDPVMISKHGHAIIDDDAVSRLTQRLLPLATLVTPNSLEAERLLDCRIRNEDELIQASQTLQSLTRGAVLVKAHLASKSVDCLATADQVELFRSPRLQTDRTHGSGCVLSAAITANLARGRSLLDAIEHARNFVHRAIQTAPVIGAGINPLELRGNGNSRSSVVDD